HPPLWLGWKWPTVGFLPLLALLTIANLMWHLDALGVVAGDAERGEILPLDLVSLMIVVMGGRLIPGYTRAMLIPLRRPKDPARELWSVVIAIALILADQAHAPRIAGAAALLLGGVQAVRLAGWRSFAASSRPILLVLHLGFG